MQLTKKIKIYPTKKQVDVLWQLSDKCRLLYNHALSERKEAWETEQKSIKYIDQQNKLPDFKKQNPEYTVVYSKVLQSVLKKLDANYKSFFALWKNGDKTSRPPKFRSTKYFMTLVYNQSGFKIKDGKVSFTHKVNEIPLSFEMGIGFDSLAIKQVEVYNDDPYKGRGNFFISVTHEVDSVKKYHDNGLYQAIDLGITKTVTAVNTHGKFLEITTPRPDKYWNPKTDTIKSRKDHCKKNSKRWNRLHKTYRKMEAKKTNQIKDFQHKLSKTIIGNTKSNTIIVGDLNVKEMTRSKKVTGKQKHSQNRSTQNQGYLSRFVGFLTYKAELAGKKVIRIDESYTSKDCCVCGVRHDMQLWNRIMKCGCGNVIDRDRNSAINIMKRFLSQNALWTSYQQFIDNLRQTGLQMDNCSNTAIQMT